MKKKIFIEILRYLFFVIFLALLCGLFWYSRQWPGAKATAKGLSVKPFHLEQVFREFDNHPEEESFWIGERRIYPAYRMIRSEDSQGNWHEAYSLTGFAFVVSGKGYQGTLDVLMGIDSGGKVTGVCLIREQEPLGYGEAFAGQKAFFEHFSGKSGRELLLRRDGGNIHAISSATITSRSVARIVQDGVRYFDSHKESFFRGLPPFVLETEEITEEKTVS